MKSGWNWSFLHSKLPAQRGGLTGNSSPIASAWSVDKQHIGAPPSCAGPYSCSFSCMLSFPAWTSFRAGLSWKNTFRHSCTLTVTKPKLLTEAVVDLLVLSTDGLSPQLCHTPSHPEVTGNFLRAEGGRCTAHWPWVSPCHWMPNALSHFSCCCICPCSLGKDSE